MKIDLYLSKHCIETEAKRLYEESLKQYFKARENHRPEMEEKIEGLKNFLVYSDFNHLRSIDPALAGTEGGSAFLHIRGADDFEIEIDGRFYRPQERK